MQNGRGFKYTVIFLFLLFIIIAAAFFKREPYVLIGNQKIFVEIADSSEERYKGLSKRPFLKKNHGMLFIFREYEKHAFVMRDMRFSIDIIWISGNTVVDISRNLPLPENGKDLPLYFPKVKVNTVLEVPAGYAVKSKITIGDKVIFFP